jgi:hypothetical protein
LNLLVNQELEEEDRLDHKEKMFVIIVKKLVIGLMNVKKAQKEEAIMAEEEEAVDVNVLVDVAVVVEEDKVVGEDPTVLLDPVEVVVEIDIKDVEEEDLAIDTEKEKDLTHQDLNLEGFLNHFYTKNLDLGQEV